MIAGSVQQLAWRCDIALVPWSLTHGSTPECGAMISRALIIASSADGAAEVAGVAGATGVAGTELAQSMPFTKNGSKRNINRR
jgi:hypothetical protein